MFPWDAIQGSSAQWKAAWDTVRTDIDATAGGLAYFMWCPGADSGGVGIAPTPYWPGPDQVDMVGVGGSLDQGHGSPPGTFAGVFGPTFHQIQALTHLPIFIDETDLAPLDQPGYQSISEFVSAVCSSGGDGVLQYQGYAPHGAPAPSLSDKQWKELDKVLAANLLWRYRGPRLTPCAAGIALRRHSRIRGFEG